MSELGESNKIKPLRQGSKLLKGLAILGIASVISKLLGTLQKIPLQNIAGDGVFGIYNAVYPLYTVILILATAGFPIAVSKFVAEFTAAGQYREASRVLRISIIILSIAGLLGFWLLFTGADYIAGIIGNSHTVTAIKSVSFAMLLLPVMAALRGYFQGLQDMKPTAVSQVMEQLIRVITMLVLLFYMLELGLNEDWIAAGATFGAVTGAAAGLFVMLYYWSIRRKTIHFELENQATASSPTFLGSITGRLLGYTFSVSLGLISVPVLNLVDSITVPRLLQQFGFSGMQAMEQFGIYSRGLPLVQLILMIAASMTVALIPAIAEAKTLRKQASIQQQLELTIRISWLVGLASAAGLAILAVPINTMFFTNSQGSMVMAISAVSALFGTVAIVTGSVLQGLGAEHRSAVHFLLAALAKIGLNYLFLPHWGIAGAAVSAVIAFALATVLNLSHIRQLTGIRVFSIHMLTKPMAALVCMGIFILIVMCMAWGLIGTISELSLHRGICTIITLISASGGALVYIWGLFRFGAITYEDLSASPELAMKCAPFLNKLRILK